MFKVNKPLNNWIASNLGGKERINNKEGVPILDVPFYPHDSAPGASYRASEFHQITRELERLNGLTYKDVPANRDLANPKVHYTYSKTFFGEAQFVHIREGEKLPHSLRGKTDKGRRAIQFFVPFHAGLITPVRNTKWVGSPTAPIDNNYALSLNEDSNIVIFDFDVDKQKYEHLNPHERQVAAYVGETRENVRLFMKALGITQEFLANTYMCISPSGGVHVGLRLPEGYTAEDISWGQFTKEMVAELGLEKRGGVSRFKGDIRTGKSNGFILLPGSCIYSEFNGIRYKTYYEHPGSLMEHLPKAMKNVMGDKEVGRVIHIKTMPVEAAEMLKRASIEHAKAVRRQREADEEQKVREAKTLSTRSLVEAGAAVKREVDPEPIKKVGATKLESAVEMTVSEESTEVDEPVVNKNLDESKEINYKRLNWAVKLCNKNLNNLSTYHSRRAYIFSLIGGCASREEVLEAWIKQGCDQDSSKYYSMDWGELCDDYYRLENKFDLKPCNFKGCENAVDADELENRAKYVSEQSEMRIKAAMQPYETIMAETEDVNEAYRKINELKRDKLKNKRNKRDSKGNLYRISSGNPVLAYNIADALEVIFGENIVKPILAKEFSDVSPRYISDKKSRALVIYMIYFMPMFNIGANPIMSVDRVMQQTGFKRYEVVDAVSVLREKGLIELAVKQSPGRVPTYKPGSGIAPARKLTKNLRQIWGASKLVNEKGERAYINGFVDYLNGKVVRLNGEVVENKNAAKQMFLIRKFLGHSRILENAQIKELLSTGLREIIETNLTAYAKRDVDFYEQFRERPDTYKVEYCSLNLKRLMSRYRWRQALERRKEFFERRKQIAARTYYKRMLGTPRQREERVTEKETNKAYPSTKFEIDSRLDSLEFVRKSLMKSFHD